MTQYPQDCGVDLPDPTQEMSRSLKQRRQAAWWRGDGGKAKGRNVRQGSRLKRMARPCEGRHRKRRKNKKEMISWPRQASYLSRWSYRNQPCLSRSARGVLLDCEAFNASLSRSNVCVLAYLEWVIHSSKIVTLLNK